VRPVHRSVRRQDWGVPQWTFPDSPELGVFVTRQLWDGREPLVTVHHADDGDWVFSGWTEAGTVEDDDLLLVCFHHVVDRFPEVAELASLDRDRHADRVGGEVWVLDEQ
jgi:hypothetical protein